MRLRLFCCDPMLVDPEFFEQAYKAVQRGTPLVSLYPTSTLVFLPRRLSEAFSFHKKEAQFCPSCKAENQRISEENEWNSTNLKFHPDIGIAYPCGHVFCSGCGNADGDHAIPRKCPTCKGGVQGCLSPSGLARYLLKKRIFSNLDNAGDIDASECNVKIQALIDMIKQHPNQKAVVFSYFKQFQILIMDQLEKANIPCRLFCGDSTMEQRLRMMREFHDSDPKTFPHVLCITLGSGGTGINLTGASRVYIMEPYWNRATEQQALDRVHGIGQKKDVQVVRFVMEGTVEECIGDLQDFKGSTKNTALTGDVEEAAQCGNYHHVSKIDFSSF